MFPALEEHQEYWVQVSAATSQGKGPLSEKYQIKTEREMIRAPTNVQAMATSDSTAEVGIYSVATSKSNKRHRCDISCSLR